MGLRLKNYKFAIILILAVFITTVLAVALSAENPGDKPGDDRKIPAPIQINDSIVDILLKIFAIEKSEIFVNETLYGSFEVEILNGSNTKFDAVLKIDELEYKEDFKIKNSGTYDFTPISFPKNGTYKIVLILDDKNEVEETNESNNNGTLEINVLPQLVILPIEPPINQTNQTNPANQTNQTNPIDNNTIQNLITGEAIFEVRNTEKPKTQSFVYLNGQLIMQIDGENNTALYYHQDLQRNVRLITDEYANVVQENYYDPFGDSFYIKNLVFNNKMFSDKEEDSSGLVYFGARYYDNDVGRFTQTDPKFNAVESSYNYVSNNPINFYDSDGRERKPNNNAPELLLKDPETQNYYLKNQLNRDGSSLNPRINPNGALFITGFGVFGVMVDNLNMMQEIKNANRVFELHEKFVWNNFWNEFIPDSQRAELRNTDLKGWRDEITGRYYKDSFPPEKYVVKMQDVEYAMQEIYKERKFFAFQALVRFYQNPLTGEIYFFEFSQDPINEEQRDLYFKMVRRVTEYRLPGAPKNK